MSACQRLRWIASMLLLSCACGAGAPTRYVIEHDLGSYAFRRYQKSLDIEIPLADNSATGHTAAYLHRQGKGDVLVVTAFVTVYAHAKALAAEARAALSTLPGYTLSTGKLSGEHVWLLSGNPQERWCVWVSGNRIVKIGAPANDDFPEPVIDAYLSLYPSDLDEHGAAQPDAPSAGAAKNAESEESEPQLPASLREGAPR